MSILKRINQLVLAGCLLTTSLIAEEVATLANNNNACYKSRDILFGLDDVFDALKKTLLQANLNIVTVTKADGVLTAKGSQYNDEEETITDITMSISFKERKKEQTSVTAIASYSTREKKSEIGQLGAGGVSLPIPVPLSGRYVMTGAGNIDDSLWYQGFYTSVDLALFEEKMKYIGDEKLLAQLKAKKDAEEKAIAEAEAKKEAEKKAKADELAKIEAGKKAKADELARIEAEKKAKADEVARKDAKEKAKAETTNETTDVDTDTPEASDPTPEVNSDKPLVEPKEATTEVPTVN